MRIGYVDDGNYGLSRLITSSSKNNEVVIFPGDENTPNNSRIDVLTKGLESQTPECNIEYTSNKKDLLSCDLLIADSPQNFDIVEMAKWKNVPVIGNTYQSTLLTNRTMAKETLGRIDGISIPRSFVFNDSRTAAHVLQTEHEGTQFVIHVADYTFVPCGEKDHLDFLGQMEQQRGQNATVVCEEKLEGTDAIYTLFFDGARFVAPMAVHVKYKDNATGVPTGFNLPCTGSVFWINEKMDDSTPCWASMFNEMSEVFAGCYTGPVNLHVKIVEGKVYLLRCSLEIGAPAASYFVQYWQNFASDMYQLANQKPFPAINTDGKLIVGVPYYGISGNYVLDGLKKANQEAHAIELLHVRKDKDGNVRPMNGLGVVSIGNSDTLGNAQGWAYDGVKNLRCWGHTYRTDIGEDFDNIVTALAFGGFDPENFDKLKGVMTPEQG